MRMKGAWHIYRKLHPSGWWHLSLSKSSAIVIHIVRSTRRRRQHDHEHTRAQLTRPTTAAPAHTVSQADPRCTPTHTVGLSMQECNSTRNRPTNHSGDRMWASALAVDLLTAGAHPHELSKTCASAKKKKSKSGRQIVVVKIRSKCLAQSGPISR